jgi:FlaA1/EpsC-like NDP-sugar epimerase
MPLFLTALPFFIVFKLLSFAGFRVYRLTWRYVGINDLCNIVVAVVMAELCLMIFILLIPFELILSHLPPILLIHSSTHLLFYPFIGFPRSIFIIDGVITLILISGVRISKRLYLEIFSAKKQIRHGNRTIIIGAGNTGEMILRDTVKRNFSDFYPVGFLDDDPKKVGAYIHGVKVLHTTDRLKAVIRKYHVEAVIIAIPSLDYKTLRNIYNTAKESEVNTIKIVPRIYDFQKPDINLKGLEDISIEDLIGRQTVDIDYREIESLIKDKVVLITGAGGSIGSEIVMQVCAIQPEHLILFDNDETELHNMEIKLKKTHSYFFSDSKLSFIVGDVRDTEIINSVLNIYKPQIIFHAAAYKHVPMMEYNPKEAVKVNMLGTYNLAKASVDYGVKKFIMISTDKAVMPTSVMGATKRMAEYVCKALNGVNGQETEFISVRFGNVLGSRGSVLPLFMEQLKHGGPLTVTHKDMKRYFMTIPEAVSLVLQASVIGRGGDILVLDMGEPVHITKLAEELIRIHGLEPYKDIDIEFIGIRPGEKLFEEILTAEEGTVASKHERVFIAKNSDKFSAEDIERILEEFKSLLKKIQIDDDIKIKQLLKKYVRHYEDNK